MGLFGKSRSDIDYDLNATIVDMLFPGGSTECAGVLKSLKTICGNKMSDVELIQFYSGLVIRCSGNSSQDSIKIRTQIAHPFLTNDLTAYKTIAFTQLHLKTPTFFLDNKAKMQMVELLAQSYIEFDKFIEKNNQIPDDYDQDDRFGLSPDVPVLVWGIDAANNYIGRLRSSANEPTTWIRQGSMSSNSVFGNTDIYILTTNNKKSLGKVYVNIYSHKVPKKAPIGFVLTDSVSTNESKSFTEPPLKQMIQTEHDLTIQLADEQENNESEGMLYDLLCNNCQSPLEIGNKFCVYCGTLIEPNQKEISIEPKSKIQPQDLNEKPEIQTLSNKIGSAYIQTETIHPKSLKCSKCGASLDENANFCSICGTKVLVNKPDRIEPKQVTGRWVTCEFCDAQNKSTSSHCEKCGKPLYRKRKKVRRFSLKLIFIVSLISVVLVIAGFFGLDYYNKFKAEEAAKQAEEDAKQARIDAALKNPSSYWLVEYSSPTGDGTYSTVRASTYNTNNYLDNITCVIVGISVSKNLNAYYYLDDAIDGGKINLKSSDFKVNGINPTIDSTEKNVCWRAYQGFSIVSNYDFVLYNTQTANFLFIINNDAIIDNDFNWRNVLITELLLDY